MSNFIHHLLAAAWSFVLVAGVVTVAAKIWLKRRLDAVEHPAQFDTSAVYLALVVPGFLPVVWLVSGLLHLEESGALTEACCSLLAFSETAWLQWVIGVGALALLGIQASSFWRRWRRSHGRHDVDSQSNAARRVRRICRGHPALAEIEKHVNVVDCTRHVCATVGLVNQRIEIATSLVGRLDDDALEAALLHEAGHLSLRDPARGTVLTAAQIINPFSGVLSREASAWRFAREIVCDGHAVESGADPASVADAIVTTARASSHSHDMVCEGPRKTRLCGAGADAIEARVKLLLTEALPKHLCEHPGRIPAMGSLVMSFGLVVPHVLGARVISFHCIVEETLTTLTFLV